MLEEKAGSLLKYSLAVRLPSVVILTEPSSLSASAHLSISWALGQYGLSLTSGNVATKVMNHIRSYQIETEHLGRRNSMQCLYWPLHSFFNVRLTPPVFIKPNFWQENHWDGGITPPRTCKPHQAVAEWRKCDKTFCCHATSQEVGKIQLRSGISSLITEKSTVSLLYPQYSF